LFPSRQCQTCRPVSRTTMGFWSHGDFWSWYLDPSLYLCVQKSAQICAVKNMFTKLVFLKIQFFFAKPVA
jgi:hypothetical protein